MWKAALILLLAIKGFSYSNGQKLVSVIGVIKDSSSIALPNATIRLFVASDTNTTISAADGTFHFQIPENISFGLLVTIEGYTTFRRTYRSEHNVRTQVLPSIIMQLVYKELEPVIVQRIKPVTVRQDTIEYRAGAFAIRAGDELERLLKKLPGLEVSIDGVVRMQGKKISKVMINGRNFTGDVLTAIRNLPADMIDIVQVIDDYGDKAKLTGIKSGESEKVLNIILFKDKRNGIFGQFLVDAGNKNKYNGALFSDAIKDDKQLTLNAWLSNLSSAGNIYKKGFYLGYSVPYNRKWLGNGSGGLSGDVHSLGSSQVQDNFFSSSHIHQEQNNHTTGANNTINASYNLIFSSDKNSTLRINPFFNSVRSEEVNSIDFYTQQQDSSFMKTITGHSQNRSNTSSSSAGTNIYFEKRSLHSKNRFSIQGSYLYSSQEQNSENLTNTSTQVNGQLFETGQHYFLQAINASHNLVAAFDYYISIGKADFLELGYSWRSVSTKNSLITRTPDSANIHISPVDSLSNDYRFTNITQRAHTGFIKHANKIDLMVGIDIQPLILNGKNIDKNLQQHYRYLNLLPLAQFVYSFSQQQKLGFEYSGNVSPPELSQLQPVTNVSNPQYPITGNPDLKPAYVHNMKLYYEQFSLRSKWVQSFRVQLSYNKTYDMIIADILNIHDSSSVIQQTTYKNVNGYNSFIAGYDLSLPSVLHKHLRISVVGSLNMSHAPYSMDNVIYKTSNLNWSQGLNLNIDVPDILESELSGNYGNTVNHYASRSGTNLSSYANWTVSNRHFILKKWILNYSAIQVFTSGTDAHLKSNPVVLNISLQRQLLKNQATCSFSIYDFFNGNTGVTQTVTPVSISETRTSLLGRYFMLSLLLKFQKFK